jgi:predicted ATP-grasp superfamily ATP-dependent carboligase
MKTLKVLITNGDNLKAYVFLKALAKHKDIEVHVAAENRINASFFSKYCKHKLITIHPREDKKKFIKQLSDYIKKNKIDILIPIMTPEVAAVVEHRKSFSNVKIPFVDHEKFTRVNNKWDFYKLMLKLKISTPKTTTVKSIEELEKLNITYPVVIKLRDLAGSIGLSVVHNKESLIKNYKALIKERNLTPQEYPLIQEFIEAENYGAGAICKNGKVLSVMVYKNTRLHHLSYGTSTSRISVIDKDIEKDVKKILESLKWHGIAQFDILKTKGNNYFIEMNPRLWMSIGLTINSGLDYPYYLARLDDNIAIPKKCTADVTSRIILEDTFVFLKSLNNKQKYPAREFLKKTYYEDVDFNDILPTIPLSIKAIRRILI